MSLDTHRTKQHTHTQANKAFHTYEGDISHRGVRISHIAWLERGYPVSRRRQINLITEFRTPGRTGEFPPKKGEIALQTPRTGRFFTFQYWQVANPALMRLLNTYDLVSNRLPMN